MIKLNGKICKDKDEAIDLIENNGFKNFDLLITLENGDEYCLSYVNGSRYWQLNGLLHREEGPAIEYASGEKFWYKHGQLHRGPAVDYAGAYYRFLDGIEQHDNQIK